MNAYPIRLSHSSLLLLNSCERKFQLTKLLNAGVSREESADLSLGKAYGAGVASYLQHQDQERAIFDAWLAYIPQLETEKKSQSKCFNALKASFSHLDNILFEYELVSFNEKPATELSFRLDIKEGFYFVGWIDAILKHKLTGQHIVFECKTTGSELNDLSPMYKNSGQALGYSIALDTIIGQELSSFNVLYFVCQIGKAWTPKIQILEYEKTILDRLNWFLSLGIDVHYLETLIELNVFPMRGSRCLAFNKPCPLFGTCDLHSLDRPAIPEPDLEVYQFRYNLDDLITNHLKRISS